MSGDAWTTIGMPKSVRCKIEEHKARGQPPYAYIEELINQVEE